MPTTVQFRRGTTAQNDAFTGAAGELSIDTDLNVIRVHDNSTAGGEAMVGASATQTLTNKTLTSPTINSGTVGTALTFNAQADARFADSDSSNWVAFQGPATIASNITWTLPNADGSSGQALVTNGSGTLSWAAAGATISSDTSTNTDFLLYFASSTSGALTAVNQDSGLTYNPSTGKITASAFAGALTGNVTGDVTGNADTATALATARTIAGNSFDGTANITIASTQLSDTAALARLAAPAFTGTATGVNLTLSGDLTVNGTTTTLATTNTVISDNLIELNNGAGSNANDSGIVIERGSTGDNAFIGWDESADKFIVGTTTATGASTGDLTITAGTLVANTFEGALSGNATTASAWQTARTLSLTGAVTGSASIDGSGNVSLATTNTADPVITLTGAVTGSGTMTNLGSVSITTTATSDPTITLAGDLSGSATLTNLGSATLTATIAANSVALGTDTTGNYVGTITGGTGISSSGATSGEGVAHTLSIDSTVATLTGTQTLTNKTLTAPVISSISNTGTLTLPTSTGTVALTSDIPTNNNQLTNGAGYTTNTGDITGVTAGTGLSGGGSSGSVTLNVDLSELTDMTAAMVGTDEFIVLDASADRRKAANEIGLSIFSNDSGFTTNTGDITNVSVSGTGLSGGGASGSVTITSNATSANTGSTIVARDGSGNFSAGVITGTSTAARYADLAEKYTSDADYESGTVLVFGGEEEVTICSNKYDKRIAGIVSTDPAYLMNSEGQGATVALLGRVPCKVIGEIRKGDLMVASDTPGHAQAWRDESNPYIGSVIGKALENKTGAGADVIEVVVGRI